jgi:hypothetical protein
MTLAREVARKGITVSRPRLLVLRIIDAFRKTMNAALGRAEDGEDRAREVKTIFWRPDQFTEMRALNKLAKMSAGAPAAESKN